MLSQILFKCAAGCGSGQIHLGGIDQPIVKCGSCGSQTCFLHKVPWHTGMTCDEWAGLVEPASQAGRPSGETLFQRAQELRATKETINRTTKPCPKCGCNIEKNGGWCVNSTALDSDRPCSADTTCLQRAYDL